MKRLLKKEEGQVLVLTVLCMSILVGFVALAADAGVLYRAKRNMQTAADAAAFAGAVELFYNGTTNVTSKAKAASKANGVDATVTGNTVLVFSPPNDGPNTACTSCVEVVVGQPSYTVLSAFTGKTKFNVTARAVAGAPGLSNDCIWLMDPHMSAQLSLQGGTNSKLSASGCSIYTNSDSSSAISITGNPNVNILSLDDVSTQTISTGTKWTGVVNSGVTPENSPLPVDFTGPTPSNGGCTHTDTTTLINSSYTPPGGATADNIVCFTNAVTLGNGASLPGAAGDGVLYVFAGGVTIANGATVNVGSVTWNADGTANTTYGATMDISCATMPCTNSAFNLSPNTNTDLSVVAPTSGTYNGIALMQPKGNNSSSNVNECSGISGCLDVEFGASGTVFDGMIFDPYGQVIMHDAGGCTTGSGGVKATGIIAASMNVKSSCLTINNYSSANPYTSPLKLVTMVE